MCFDKVFVKIFYNLHQFVMDYILASLHNIVVCTSVELVASATLHSISLSNQHRLSVGIRVRPYDLAERSRAQKRQYSVFYVVQHAIYILSYIGVLFFVALIHMLAKIIA